MKELAIIGPTASGKSSLAIKLAKEFNANILSADSLSIYKEIDIVSAKPSKKELKSVKHFGIDVVYPNIHFSVEKFIKLYKEAKEITKKENKNLIIAGGTIFYLKALLNGLSPMPAISKKTEEKVKKILTNIDKAYNLLKEIDKNWANKITSKDRYRIEKALGIYFETSLTPSSYFAKNPPIPAAQNILIFNIEISKDKLLKRVEKRTLNMIKDGLIDEICYLEKKYGRDINPMKAIGIIETLEYLDGKISLKELENKITKNTLKLAKRQKTFIKTQLKNSIPITLSNYQKIVDYLQKQA